MDSLVCEYYEANPAARFLPREPTGNNSHAWESQRNPGDPNRLTFWEDRPEHLGSKNYGKETTVEQVAPAVGAPVAPIGKAVNKSRNKLASRWDVNNSARAATLLAARGVRKAKLAAPITSSLVLAWAAAHDSTERGARARAQIELTKAAAAGKADDDYAA